MRAGETWRGADGTHYKVVNPATVRPDQPRWWVDEDVAPGDTMCGPAASSRLHLLTEQQCGLNKPKRTAKFALVAVVPS